MQDMSDVIWNVSQDENGLSIHRTQDIPEDYLAWLRECRDESAKARMGNTASIAHVPAFVWVQWMNDGFDIFKEPHSAIIKRLKNSGLDGFLTSNKRI